jgi:hypothetical protein
MRRSIVRRFASSDKVESESCPRVPSKGCESDCSGPDRSVEPMLDSGVLVLVSLISFSFINLRPSPSIVRVGHFVGLDPAVIMSTALSFNPNPLDRLDG